MKQSEALYAVALLSPATPREVKAYWETKDRGTSPENVSKVLLGLYRENLVIRRRRDSDRPGKQPYEYAVAPDDEYTGETEP